MTIPDYVNRPTDGNPAVRVLPPGTPLLVSRAHPFEVFIESGKQARRSAVLKAKKAVRG